MVMHLCLQKLQASKQPQAYPINGITNWTSSVREITSWLKMCRHRRKLSYASELRRAFFTCVLLFWQSKEDFRSFLYTVNMLSKIYFIKDFILNMSPKYNKTDLLKEHGFSACTEFADFRHAVAFSNDKCLFLQKFQHVP